ncbi:MAG: CBS domain-containing protein [Rhizobiales bacterium]|nr:CBS domain-containing protein [Hyphomicrobiales bacterium]OJY43865.1 MAG: inosine-5-monophosphate dehydrogenase [Rhizobiales bacterium 64-17]
MTIRTILAAKSGDVAVIEPAATLQAAAQQMSERRVGALVVLGTERRVIGILSERDIVRSIAKHGADGLKLPVSQAMTREVMTCTEEETIGGVMSRMTEGRFRHLPVVHNEAMVGIVSIGDVVKFRVGEMETESEALRDYIRTA